MDVRLIIVAGASAFFAIALVVFVVAVAGARRAARENRSRSRTDWSSGDAHGTGTLDTDLAGLDVHVAEDALSASLLTPLRESEWSPPAEPAPIKELAEASLEGRVADYRTAPAIADPPFSIPQRPAWSTAPELERPEQAAQSEPSSLDDELEAELAALLPNRGHTAGIEPEPVPAIEEVLTPAPAPAPAPAPEDILAAVEVHLIDGTYE